MRPGISPAPSSEHLVAKAIIPLQVVFTSLSVDIGGRQEVGSESGFEYTSYSQAPNHLRILIRD